MALAGWDYRKKLSIDNTKVDAALTDLPVLVKLDNTNFDFTKIKSDGSDIRFTSDDGDTLLSFEKEDLTINTGGIDANTKLMLHLNGSDTSTVIIDDSPSAHSPVVVNDAELDTDVTPQLGSASATFDGAGDVISIPDSPDWNNWGTQDLTIDCWVNFSSGVGHNGILGRPTSGGSYFYWAWESSANIRFRDYNGANVIDISWGNPAFTLNTWYHLAVTRSGNNFRFFVDGVQFGATVVTGAAFLDRTGTTLEVGGISSINYYMTGNIDECRIQVGKAEWTSNFTPPVAEYNDSIIGGEAYYWVKVPTVSDVSDTDLFLYYGNEIVGDILFSDDLTNPAGAATAAFSDSEHDGSHLDDFAFDNNRDGASNRWATLLGTPFPHWIGWDFGVGNKQIINAYEIKSRNDSSWDEAPYDFIVQGSPELESSDLTDGLSANAISDSEDGGEINDNAFDNNGASIWGSSTGAFPHYIGIDFGVANEQVINTYTILARNDASFDENPYDWTLEASTTGAWSGEEVTLDTQVNVAFTQAQKQYFTNFSGGINTTAYRYYRILVTDNQPAAGNTKAALAQVEFMSGGNWVDLDTRVNEDFVQNQSRLFKFSVENTTAYAAYRILGSASQPGAINPTQMACTEIQLFKGNSNPSDTWNSDYKAVYHLKESGAGVVDEYFDSTINSHYGQGQGTVPALVDGIVYKGQDGAGTSSYINVPDSDDFYFDTDFTLEWKMRWIGSVTNGTIMGQSEGAPVVPKCFVNYGNISAGDMSYHIQPGGAAINFTWSPAADTDYHCVMTKEGDNYKFFVDGVQVGGTQVNATAIPNCVAPFNLFTDGQAFQWFDGVLDEVRITKGVARPVAELKAIFNSDNDTLLAFGAEEGIDVTEDIDTDIRVICAETALAFDGVDDKVQYLGAAHVGYPISFFCRAKINGSGGQFIWSQSRSNTSGNYMYLIGEPGADWAYDVRSNSGPTHNANGWSSLEVAGCDNDWHNIVCISAASNDHKLYIDDVLVGSSTVNAAFPSSPNRTQVANWVRSGSNTFGEVSVSEFGIWDSVLSAPDITLLNNNLVGQSVLVSPGNLKLSWSLNTTDVGVSASGDTITDDSNSGFDGLASGTDGPLGIQTGFCLANAATLALEDISTDIRIVHSESLSDVDTDIRAASESILDVNADIRINYTENQEDINSDIRAAKLQIDNIDTDIRINYAEDISDIDTDIRAIAPALFDVDTDIRAAHGDQFNDINTDIRINYTEIKEDIDTDIRVRIASLEDIDTDIRVRIASLSDIDNDIRVIQQPSTSQVIVNGAYFVEGVFVCEDTVTIIMDVDNAINMAFRRESEAVYSAYETYADTKVITLSAGDGNKSIFIKFQDIEGSETDGTQLDIVKSTATPTGVTLEAYEDDTLAVSITDSVYQNDKGPFFRWALPIFDIPYTGFSYALDAVPLDVVNLIVPDMVRDGILVTKATPFPEMTLDISSGFFYVAAGLAEHTAETLLLSNGGAQDRIDLIYLDGVEYTIKSVEGVEAASPVAPNLPNLNNPIALAEVLVPAGETLIAGVTITDIRDTHVNLPNYLDANLTTGIRTLQVKAITQCDTISNISTFNVAVANPCPEMGEILGYTDGTKTIQLVSNIYQTASSSIFLEWTASPNEPGPITYYYTTDGSEPTLASSSTTGTTLNLGPFSEGITTINIKPFDDTTGNSCRTKNFIFVFGSTSPTGDTLVISGGTTLKQSLKEVQVNTISWNFDSARICKIFQPVAFDATLPFSLNDAITVVHNDVTIFSGKIRKIDRAIAESGEGVTYICTGPRGILTECFAVVDTPDGLDSAIITFENEPVGDAVTSIINTVPSAIQSVESLPTGSDINATYRSQSVDQALQNLFIRTKYGWYIEPNGTFVSVAADVVNPNDAKFGVYGTVVNSISPQFNVMDSNLQFDVSKRYNRAIVEGSNKQVLRDIDVDCLASESFNGFYLERGNWEAGDFTKYRLNTDFKVTKVIETQVSYKRLLSFQQFGTPFGSTVQTGWHYNFLDFETCTNNEITHYKKNIVLSPVTITNDTFPQGTLAGDNIISFPREAANIWFRTNPRVPTGDLGVDVGVSDTIFKYCANVSASALIETEPLRVDVSVSGTADGLGSKTLRIVDTSFKYTEDPDDPIDDTARMTAFANDKLESLKDVKVNGTITLDTVDTSWSLKNSVNLINTAQGSWTTLNAKIVAIKYNFDTNTTVLELTSEFLK